MKINNVAFARSKDSDQLGYMPSLIRVFTVCMNKAKGYRFKQVTRLSSESLFLYLIYCCKQMLCLMYKCCYNTRMK